MNSCIDSAMMLQPCDARRCHKPRSYRSREAALTALLSLVVWLTVSYQTVCGQEQRVIDSEKEYSVKGAFLYSFGRYTKWPPGSFAADSDPFVIGVLGDAPINAILSRIEKTKDIDGRRIVIQYLKTVESTNACHILFVPRSLGAAEQLRLIRFHDKSPVMLVGETDDFAAAGGVIRFFVREDLVKFEINVNAATEKKLLLDAKLLRLAEVIESRAASVP